MNVRLIFVLISLLHYTTSDITLSTDFRYLTDTDFIFPTFTLGTPPKPLYQCLNTLLPFSHLFPSTYNTTISSSGTLIKENNTIMIEKEKYNATRYSDKLIFGNPPISIIPNFNFYTVSASTHSWSDGFGFAFKFEDESFSIIHQLQKNKQITKKAFGIIPHKNGEPFKGTLYYGEVSYDIILKDYKYKGTCDVSDNYTPWGCQMISISIGKKEINFEQYGFISTCQYFMILSLKFFDFMIDTVFREWIDEETCFIIEGLLRSTLRCGKNVIKMGGDVKFKFDNGLVLNIPLIDLFICDDSLCESLVASDNSDSKNFEFGMAFVRLFNATIFSYDNRAISFYSDKYEITFEDIPIKHFITKKSIIIISIFELLAGIIIEIYISKFLL